MSGRKGLAQTAFREADGMDLRDRVVVVTGASSGIGRETARVFAQRGAVVIAVARREERLRSLVQELRDISPRSEYLVGDLGHRDFAERVIAQTVERHGRLDILVNNAALTKHKRIDRVSPEEAQRALVENFTGAFQPIARDVKIQVEFDPAQVASYRLLGYENRAIADEVGDHRLKGATEADLVVHLGDITARAHA